MRRAGATPVDVGGGFRVVDSQSQCVASGPRTDGNAASIATDVGHSTGSATRRTVPSKYAPSVRPRCCNRRPANPSRPAGVVDGDRRPVDGRVSRRSPETWSPINAAGRAAEYAAGNVCPIASLPGCDAVSSFRGTATDATRDHRRGRCLLPRLYNARRNPYDLQPMPTSRQRSPMPTGETRALAQTRKIGENLVGRQTGRGATQLCHHFERLTSISPNGALNSRAQARAWCLLSPTST